MDIIKSRLDRLARHWLYKRTQPTYEMLGVKLHSALTVALPLFGQRVVKDQNSMGYQLGYYTGTADHITRLSYDYSVEMTKEKRELAQKVSLLFDIAGGWHKTILSGRDLEFQTDWIVDLCDEVTKMAGELQAVERV